MIDRGTRSFWFLQLGGWAFYGLATFLTFLASVEPGGWWGLFQFKGVARPTAGILVSSALALAYRELDHGGRSGPTIAAAAAVGSVAGGIAWFVLSGLLMWPLAAPGTSLIAWQFVPHGVLEYVFVMLAWSAAFFGVRAWRRSRDRERRALEAEASATEARLRMLTYQLNPHFLFNALSSLRGLVRRDPERAETTLTRLAAFLRYALIHPMTHEVPLHEELDSVRAYLDVERSRLGSGLDVRIQVEDAAAREHVPAFLLYPLVENAVKHASPQKGAPTQIQIRARIGNGSVVIEVANPGELASRSDGPPGTGVGLRNVRERLAHYYPGRHGLTLHQVDGWVHARIEIEREGGE